MLTAVLKFDDTRVICLIFIKASIGFEKTFQTSDQVGWLLFNPRRYANIIRYFVTCWKLESNAYVLLIQIDIHTISIPSLTQVGSLAKDTFH